MVDKAGKRDLGGEEEMAHDRVFCWEEEEGVPSLFVCIINGFEKRVRIR